MKCRMAAIAWLLAVSPVFGSPQYGPKAAVAFELSYRGAAQLPGAYHCYPDAHGIPFSDTKNIVPMTAKLWTPAELVADFQRRMSALGPRERKQGIIVLLKTERCCTKVFRGCSCTTAALEKRSTPLAGEFLIYGAWIKPRDHDNPPGSLKIETGGDAWKNDAAGVYRFEQGPGATVVFLDPRDGSVIVRTNALKLQLSERQFLADGGRAPLLDAAMRQVFAAIAKGHVRNAI